MNLRRNAAALLCLALLSGACSNGRSSTPVVADITSVQGSVTLIREGREQQIEGTEQVRAGDVLLATEDSIGLLQFGSGNEIEMRASRLEVLEEGVIELEDGTVLVTSDADTEVRASGVVSTVSSGNARFDLTQDLRVGTYDVDALRSVSSEDEVDMPSYWQVTYAPDGSATAAGPLQFSAQDPIDRRLLEAAIRVDSELGNLLRGLEPQLATGGGSAVVAHVTDQGLEPSLVAAFPDAPRADLLVALVFARQQSDSLPGDLGERFGLAMHLRNLEATWGLLAQQFSLSVEDLLVGIEEQIVAVLFPPVEEVPQGGEFVPRPGATAAPPPPASPPTATPPPVPGQPGAPDPTPSPTPTPHRADPPQGLLPDELVDIVDELFGLVDSLIAL